MFGMPLSALGFAAGAYVLAGLYGGRMKVVDEDAVVALENEGLGA